MKTYFKELFEYNHYFNQQLANVFNEQHDRVSNKAVQLFNHILNAHQLWNHRIESGNEAVGAWAIRPSVDFSEIDRKNYETSLMILSKYDLKSTVSYVNSRGEAFTSSIRDILFHIINHSTYHKGQIATEFRQHGVEPLAMDFIFYKR